MIIKDKKLPPFLFKITNLLICWLLKRFFHKFVICPIEIKPNYSYLLMCNHLGFWDGLWARYLVHNLIDKKQPIKGFSMMSLKKQMLKRKWLRYMGSFSVDPGKKSVKESLDYAAKKLSESGNVLLFFPQGNLESMHVQKIQFLNGLKEIVPKISGNCQLIWCSQVPEYFENLRPTVFFDVLDCGTNHNFNFNELVEATNKYHKQALQNRIRFTK